MVLFHDMLAAIITWLPIIAGQTVDADAFAGAGVDEVSIAKVDAAV